jgi:hypothetical protein
MNSAFSEDILADKLAKLNNTQQCIESILACLFSVQIFEYLGCFLVFGKSLVWVCKFRDPSCAV